MISVADAQPEPTSLPHRRRHPRYEYEASCDLKSARRTMRATTRNISEGGICLKLQSFGSVDLGDVIAIEMPDFPLINGTVAWTNNRIVGVEFIDSIRDTPEIRDLLDRLAGH